MNVKRTSHRRLLEHYLIPILKKGTWTNVLDVGSKDARYKKHITFLGKYVTLDPDPAHKCDVVSTIEDYKAPGQYDLVICSQVLEHTPTPKEAIESIRQVLVKGGKAVVSVPWIFPTHASEDYHRFNDQSLCLLFKNWSHVKITPYGNFISSAWLVFNFHNKFWPLNWLFALIGRKTIPSTSDGFIVEAIK